jgi:hypothetical protein
VADCGEAPVSLETILCTDELERRPRRAPDFERENHALVTLTQALSAAPEDILQTLADTILRVCGCGSAGVSLLSTDDGGKRFYWPAIAGSWKAHIRLTRTAERIELEVTDKGRGLSPETQEKLNAGSSVGVGFRGMQERLKLIGGALEVHSPGVGTSVLVVLPIRGENGRTAAARVAPG